MGEKFTWDDLYKRAEGAGCGDERLVAKDNARFILTGIILEQTGVNIDECEIPEEVIEAFLDSTQNKYWFDENGNLLAADA